MDLRHSINLLTTSIVVIIMLLMLMAGYTLSFATTANQTTNLTMPTAIGEPVDEQVSVGKKLWETNACGACHNKSMTVDATGPALAGVTSRWADYPRTDLYAWVRNNPKLVASGHPRAVEVAAANPNVMNVYPDLSDDEIEAILAYIERP